jgi:hypothetical protein
MIMHQPGQVTKYVYVWEYKMLCTGLEYMHNVELCTLDAYNSLASLLQMLFAGIYLDGCYMMPSLTHQERVMNIIFFLDSLDPHKIMSKASWMEAMIDYKICNGLVHKEETRDLIFEDHIDSVMIGVYHSEYMNDIVPPLGLDPNDWEIGEDPKSVTEDIFNLTWDEVQVLDVE